MQMEIKAYNLSKDIKDDLYKKMEDSERVHLKAEVTTILTCLYLQYLALYLLLL